MIHIKRTYDPPAREDGRRFLVERLWPRGMKKESLIMDEWLKDVAPSAELRKWFGHQPERWAEFQKRYKEELRANPDGWKPLLEASKRATVTLLYSAHDIEHNGAIVLRDFLSARQRRRATTVAGSSTARSATARARKSAARSSTQARAAP
jgi:uncharacterized protein YeaO (DUF488 family)